MLPHRGALQVAVDALAGRRLAVLTGAGISTDSGIPSYRGHGSHPQTPMTISDFMNDARYRKRYWAGSQLGWARFGTVTPNAGHRVLATLERADTVSGVMTQNVDSLHQRAGSSKVVELHGSSHRVRCVNCSQMYAREAVAETLAALNPWLADIDVSAVGPDGDVAFRELDLFAIPECGVCGGILRPDIVYFGEFIPAAKNLQSSGVIATAGALLVVGSSLVVNSGIRLVDRAERRGLPVVIINRGATRADARATVKIDGGASDTLAALAEGLVDASGRAEQR